MKEIQLHEGFFRDNFLQGIMVNIARYSFCDIDKIVAFANLLKEIDWDSIFKTVQEEEEVWKEEKIRREKEFQEEEVYCRGCFIIVQRKNTIYFNHELDNGGNNKYSGCYCADCYKKILINFEQDYKQTCQLCGITFFKWCSFLCYSCDTEYNRREYFRVNRQNRRTRELNLPSTLTLIEWMKIIDSHNGKCAYCETKVFEDMDHVIPVSKGGGTTAENVLPACGHCNNHKSVYGELTFNHQNSGKQGKSEQAA